MWSYYGSKTNIANEYPHPMFDTLFECCAGAAKYGLEHFEKEVILYDKYEVIFKIWDWLINHATESDILNLPLIKRGQTLNDFTLSEPEKLLMGFIIAKGGQSPRITPSPNATINRPNTINYQLKNISGQLYKIKHWKVVHGSYEDIPNIEATYFMDPPYQFGGHVYIEGNKNIDFPGLANWCKTRLGQIIVCENMKADWLPFLPMQSQRTSHGWQREAIWTNYHTHFNNVQQELILT